MTRFLRDLSSAAAMEFNYIERESDLGTLHVPTLPISLNGFPVGHAMIDTGADVTILPMEVNTLLGMELDQEHSIDMFSAGGGRFTAIPAAKKIRYSLEHSGFRPIVWLGTAFFAPRQPTILLGHYQCLEQLNLCFRGRKRTLSVEQAKERLPNAPAASSV